MPRAGAARPVRALPGRVNEQPLKRLRILGWDVTTGYRLVVGPQCDDEAVTHIDARLHPRIERSYGTIGFGEPTSDLDFELCDALARHVGDPS